MAEEASVKAQGFSINVPGASGTATGVTPLPQALHDCSQKQSVARSCNPPEVDRKEWKKNLAAKQQISLAMARAAGADLISFGPADAKLRIVVLSWGSGMLMATCDHLLSRYPGLAILGADLPLGMGTHRAVVIDWIASVWRTYLVIWAAGLPSSDYLAELQRRRLNVKRGWIYLQPRPSREEALAWARLGFVTVWDPWAPQPLPELQ